MKIEHITNKSATNFYNELSKEFSKASEIIIATAFINNYAITLVEEVLKKNVALGNIKILIGMYNFFNKKSDLEYLLQLVKNYPHKLQVNISLDMCFHWKFYQLHIGRLQVAYIGSANFTLSGLVDNRELVAKISDSKTSSSNSLSSITKSFEKEWTNSSSIADFPLKHYHSAQISSDSLKLIHPGIKDFFNQKIRKRHQVVDNGKAYAIAVGGHLKASTEKAISYQKSSWSKRDLQWAALNTKRAFLRCSAHRKIIVFDKIKRGEVQYYWANIIETCDDIKTDDGKYFVAYKIISENPIDKTQIATLRNPPFKINLTGRIKPFDDKVIAKKQLAEIKKLLGFR